MGEENLADSGPSPTVKLTNMNVKGSHLCGRVLEADHPPLDVGLGRLLTKQLKRHRPMGSSTTCA